MSRQRAKSLPRDGEAHQQCARCVIPLVGHVHVPVHVETEREESLSAIRIRNPHHPPGHGSWPFNFYCCPNSTSSIDLTASSACLTIIKKSSCPENWQGDHPSGLRLRLHYAYALTPKMESTTSPPSPTTRHFDLHTLPFSARTAASPGRRSFTVSRARKIFIVDIIIISTSISMMMSKQASKLVRNSS